MLSSFRVLESNTLECDGLGVKPLTDAYCHLDMECASPIEEIRDRMRAGITRALLVETWNGRNRRLLETVAGAENGKTFRVALCYRKESEPELRAQARARRIAAIRIASADLPGSRDFCREIGESGIMVIAHADTGIGTLATQLTELHRSIPELPLYVPHLGWPNRDGRPDPDWPAAMETIAAIPTAVVGISAISHFSALPFPHDDIVDCANRVAALFPPSRIVIGSDYPLIEKARYGDYMSLARNWVISSHPEWKDRAQFLFES